MSNIVSRIPRLKTTQFWRGIILIDFLIIVIEFFDFVKGSQIAMHLACNVNKQIP